jgi:hypothetical protein
MGDKNMCYTCAYRNGRGTLQDYLRRRGGGQLEEPDYRTSFLVSLKQSRKAAVITANHLPTSTRPPRSHSARVAAPALAQRPVYAAPIFYAATVIPAYNSEG